MLKEIVVPDIGNYSNVNVIEVLVSPGDVITKESSLIALETDKASIEIPAPNAGTVKALHVKVGDKVSAGTLIVSLETEATEAGATEKSKEPTTEAKKEEPKKTEETEKKAEPKQTEIKEKEIESPKLTEKQETLVSKPTGGIVHAGPGVRRFARELGADLSRIQGAGPKNRILKTDVQKYIKTELTRLQSGATGGLGLSVAPWPQIDFARFGEVSVESLSRIKKLTGTFLHRNWVSIPHVTQFDEADVTELESFRKEQQTLAEKQNVKLTVLAFIIKAVTSTLSAFPTFNASLTADGTQLILKKYFHIGVAVDTPNGLVVPVVRNVDQKGLFKLAKELGEISSKARLGQLTGEDMQGSSFTISSLGGIGGTAFTPIINVPDVAILGVSKAQMKPIYQEGAFVPRLMLPLSLSYDHRVIDGAEGARFITYLVKQLSDIRRLLL